MQKTTSQKYLSEIESEFTKVKGFALKDFVVSLYRHNLDSRFCCVLSMFKTNKVKRYYEGSYADCDRYFNLYMDMVSRNV